MLSSKLRMARSPDVQKLFGSLHAQNLPNNSFNNICLLICLFIISYIALLRQQVLAFVKWPKE